jgi:DNA polymerase I-like protein with 3'-5' exonuclease and polymerase domains/5'-3' exonuclease
METAYSILDFKAVIKHSYYGANCPESIYCEEVGRSFPRWQTGAQGLISRYLEPIVSADGPRNLLVAHDMGTDYRTGIYPTYKVPATPRVKSPVEKAQCDMLQEWAKRFLTALGATQIGVPGVEADDVIAWLCGGITSAKTVYTVDADLLQLCNDMTCVQLKNEPHFGEGHHKSIPYNLMSISKSLLGDSSDEYPGIKGIGPKAWDGLLETFGADGIQELQGIVESGNPAALDQAIEATGDKTLIKLRANFADWRVMWRLAKLHPELCWKPRARKLIVPVIHKRVPNPQQLFTLLKEVGAEDLWDSVFAATMPSPFAVTADNWEEMKDAIFSEIEAGDITAFDYESSNKNKVPGFAKASASGENFVDVLSQELAGASFQFGKHLENVIYIPVDHKDSPNLPCSVIAEILEHAGKCTRLVAQNAFFEGVVSQTNLHLELKGVHDTRIMQRFFNENAEAGLKAMSKAYLNVEQVSYAETLAAGNGGEGVNLMCELTLDEVFSYGAEDSQVTGHIYDLLKLMLMLDNQWAFYERYAVDPTVVLQHSYIKGVDVNWALQKRVHDRDLKQVADGMVKLRAILEENITGEVTEGCKSLIASEKDYVYRGWKKKLECGEQAKTKLYEWQLKQERACQYQPYREESVMPTFALTTKQLQITTDAIGLPVLEKVTAKAITEYLADLGMLGFEGQPTDPAQLEFLTALAKAVEKGALKVKALETKAEEGDERAARDAEHARAAFSSLAEVSQRLGKVEAKTLQFGDELNVGSPAQMQQLLYCKIGVPVTLKGKIAGKGRTSLGIKEAGPSTDEIAILTAIANDIEKGSWQHKALEAMLKVKSATTRISLYHDKYPLWRHRDGKIHPSFTDAGTDTMRPTGTAPNVLQVSKRDKDMRGMYMPPSKDHVVVAIDYNGQEIRLMACESGDPVMISVYDPLNEKDLHSMTGCGIAKMPYELFVEAKDDEHHELNGITNAIRKKAKGVNFGLAYGAGAATLSRNLIVPREEAAALLSGTMSLYSQIPVWQDNTGKFMARNGFTITAFGTKRHATPDVFSSDGGKVARQYRQGINATIQQTAADMLRIVLTGIVERDLLHRLDMVFFAPIYDETVAFVHKDDVLEYCREMQEIMSGATPPGHVIQQIPEFSIGPTWGNLHELGRKPSDERVLAAVQRSLQEAEPIWAGDMQQTFETVFPYLEQAA